MATRFQLNLALAFLAVVSLRMRAIDGCSPPLPGYEIPETLEYKMANSDVVVKGHTRHRHRDTSFPADEAYIVDFEISCIFKGDPLPEMIRIYRVGSIGGLCLSTEMPQNKSLLVYLSREGDQLVPSYHEDPGTHQYIEEVVVLCETKIAYPEGKSESTNSEDCPEPYEYDDCVPIPTMKTIPDVPTGAPPMDEIGTGKDNVKNGHNKNMDNGKGNSDSTNTNNKNMNKEGDHTMNKNNKGKGGNGDGGEAAYESVRTNAGGSKGGDVDTGDSSGNTGAKEGGEGFDPDGSMSSWTFNLLVPLAMLTVWFVLV